MSYTNDFRAQKIFVGGIPAAVSEDDLMIDKIFVVFDNDKVVGTLLADGNMIDMDGTQVEIKKEEPKKSSSSAFFSFPPFGSDSRSRSCNDGYSGFGNSYGGFPGRGYESGAGFGGTRGLYSIG